MKGSDLYPLIESHLHKFIQSDGHYSLLECDAFDLINPNRFDLGFKLAFLEWLKSSPESAFQIYKAHISALSLGSFSEPGNPYKNTLKEYYVEFLKIYMAIESSGFNSEMSVLPLSRNGNIANGAHRLAAAIFSNRKVSAIELKSTDHLYDYKFFKSRGVPDHCMDLAALALLSYVRGARVAILWPSSGRELGEVCEILGDVYYTKSLNLTAVGQHSLVCLAYKDESWLGSSVRNFPGAFGKQRHCFTRDQDCHLIFFANDDDHDVIKKKADIRRLCNVGKHSIHITDDKSEAMRLGRCLLFRLAEHYLNSGIQFSSVAAPQVLKLLEIQPYPESPSANVIALSPGEAAAGEGSICLEDLGVVRVNDSSLANQSELVFLRGDYYLQIVAKSRVTFADFRSIKYSVRFYRAYLGVMCLGFFKASGLFYIVRWFYRHLIKRKI